MGDYTVQKGDTLSKIAARYGIRWPELYNHPLNEDFRARRSDPNRIYPGDKLWVPNVDDQDEPQYCVLDLDLEDEPPDSKYLNPRVFQGASNVQKYKVRTGDTLESIAEELEIDWESIALLNWGTSDREEIEYYLEHYFVCETKKDGHYVFSKEDDPGILMLPAVLDLGLLRARRTLRASRFEDK